MRFLNLLFSEFPKVNDDLPFPTTGQAWIKPKDFRMIVVNHAYKLVFGRELRRRVYHPALGSWIELTIVTTLLDEATYPAQKLVELRLRRWQAETNLRHLKTTMGLEALKCKTVNGVRKELAGFVLVCNLVRVLMLEAATRQKTRPGRISFADVLGWVRVAHAGDAMPRFVINPVRPQRIDPRVVKRRGKPYALMNCPRQEAREALKKQAQMA